MAEEPRIAFAATYLPNNDRDVKPHILLIGTVDTEGEDWRYARLPLDDFEAQVGKTSYNPFDPVHTSGDTVAASAPSTSPMDAANAAAVSQLVIEVTRVSVLAVCPAGSGLHQEAGWNDIGPGRLARLETVDSALDTEGHPLDIASWVVSFVRLTPGSGPGELSDFDINVQIRMPLGAHSNTVGSARGDRFDTRLFLRMSASRGSGRSLWKTGGQNGQMLQRRGAVCDKISLTATTAPWNNNPLQSRDEISLPGRGDLIDFARDAAKEGRYRYNVQYVPLLAGLDIPMGGRLVKPYWGFRVAQYHDQARNSLADGGGRAAAEGAVELEPSRLILRAEFQVTNFGGEVRKLYPPGLGPTADPDVFFSEEQRVADVALPSMRPQEQAHWIVALRLDGTRHFPVDSLTRAVLSTYRDTVAMVHQALRRVRDGAPLSLLPSLADPTGIVKPSLGAVPWHLVGVAIDREPHIRRIVTASETPQGAATRAYKCRFLSYEPRFIFDKWQAEQDMRRLQSGLPHDDAQNPLMASRSAASFRGLVDTDRKRPAATALIVAPIIRGFSEVNRSAVTRGPAFQAAVTELDFADTEEFVLAVRFGIRFKDFGASRSLGLGAFLLQLSETTTFKMSLSEDTTGLVVMRHLVLNERDETRYPDTVDPRLPWGIQARLLLPVGLMLPFGQDELPEGAREGLGPIALRDRRDESVPLLLDLKKPPPLDDETVDFTLAAVETASRIDDQSVTLSVRATRERRSQTHGPEARGMVLVLDPAPFRVAGVEFSAPESAATDESNEIAVWNPQGENGLSWRVRDDGQSVRMILPPQVIGEGMEKNPVGPEELPSDVVPERAAAARFGAPTYLEVDPTFAETGFREPGWNLRRVMGYVGQRSPGSRLKDLRLELLYGLTARARPAREVQAWVTEMAGVLGRPPLPIDDIAGDAQVKRHLSNSRRILQAERRRVAVDRVWSDRPDTALRLEDGATFQLRMKEPDPQDPAKSLPSKGPQTPLRWPVLGSLPPKKDTGAILDEAGYQRLEHTFVKGNDDRETFPGGAAWAFESANILMSVYANPVSDGGRLAGIHMSALGGYGTQRALFDAKKSVIETETTQGRTHRYKLERIGRVGALWHRAKHVIVYERTVVPSAQFYNRPPIGLGQDEHRGRPILRKVEEYVEILQPSRRYPEDGSSVAACGCLVGAEFKSRRIRVDSRWGEDVRREGWRVPLWNRVFATDPGSTSTPNFNPDDPSLIYPKPQIRFVLAGEGAGEISCEVDEPEKLFFYTSVVKGESGDDTDSWRPVREVDFVDLPIPRCGTLAPRSEHLTDAILPSEPDHVPGYEQFTIGLVRSSEAAKLTHGLLPQGPAAVLKNLTIARTIVGAASSSDASQVGQVLADSSADLRATADGALGIVIGALEKLDPVKDAANLKTLAKQHVREASKSLARNIATKTEEIKGKFAGLDRIKSDLSSPCAAIEREVRAVVASQTERLQEVVTRALESATRDAMSVVTGLAAEARGTIDATELQWDELLARLLGLRERLYAVFDEVREDLNVIRVSTKANLEALKRIAGTGLEDEQAQLVEALDRAIAAIRTQVAAPSQDNLEAAGRSLREARAELSAVMDRLAKGTSSASARRIATAVDVALAAALSVLNSASQLPAALQAIERLHNAINDRSQALASDIMSAMVEALDNLVVRGIDQAVEIVRQLQDIVELTTLDPDTGDTLLDLIDRVIEAITREPGEDEPEDPGQVILAALEHLEALIGEIEKSATTAIRDVTSTLSSVLNQASDAINQQLDGLVRALASACAALEGFAVPLLQNLGSLGEQFEKLLDLGDYERRLTEQLERAIDEAGSRLDEIKRQVSAEAERIGREVENRTRQFAGAVQESIRDQVGVDPVLLADRAERAFQQGGETLQLLRAVGDPPKTNGLGLNRPAVAYVASQVDKVIKITPAIALVNRVADTAAAIDQAGAAVGDLLQSFGVRAPTGKITDQFIPEKCRNLSVPDLVPDMAGIDFRGLLREAGFPDIDDANAIKITRGFDEAKLQAWLSADIDVPLTKPTVLLSFGPVQIVINSARFFAQARLEMTPAGVKKSMKGHITGDWRVVTAGQDILTFRRTGLYFDDTGHINFKIDPERVELAPALEFVTNFLVAAGKGDGLVVEPLMRGAIPAGIAASLSTQLPDLQLGVFGISSLSLDVLFGVAAIPEFELLCDLSLSSRTAPFTLNVWILNGGGYITQRLSFRPMARPRPLLVYTLDVGIVAGVGLGFNFGVVSGGVWLQVGCSIAITWTTGSGGSTTAVTVFVLARGNVDVCGLVTASISLLLEVTYDGARMIGAGTLRLSFKISMFYTLNVTQRVEYTFIGQKRPQEASNYSDTYA